MDDEQAVFEQLTLNDRELVYCRNALQKFSNLWCLDNW